MGRRFVKFHNYRNIGVSKDEGKFEQLSLNSSLEKENVGQLIILIGENNAGKSNVLDGIAAIIPKKGGEGAHLSESDAPDFIDFEDARPEIALEYDDVGGKSLFLSRFLDKEGRARLKASPELEAEAAEAESGERRLSEESEAALKKEVEGKLKEYEEWIKGYDEDEDGQYLRRLGELSGRYAGIAAAPEGIDLESLKDVYSRLKELLGDFVSSYNNSYMEELSPPEFIDLDSLVAYAEEENARADAIDEKLGIRLVPQIVYYKEEEIRDSELVAAPDAIRGSRFFNALLKAAGTSVDAIAQAYEKAEKVPSHKKRYQNSINEKLKETVNRRFNELFFQGLPSEEYNFEITLEKDEIYLSMEKNGSTFSLSQQSAGFRWFFNFFFGFLYAACLQAGDIVLMDDPASQLSVPARRDLRSFLRGFAKDTGVTFIAATQNPDLVDPDFLDEVRLVRQKKGESGAGIQNDFSAIADDGDDATSEMLAAFGLQHREIAASDESKAIYVEDIACYNYLTAFKMLKEEEEKKKVGLAFLPIGDLGLDEEQIKRKLPLLARRKGAVLLDGSDKKGEAFAAACEGDAQIKYRLDILQLKVFDARFIQVEDLFAPADKERYKEMLAAKSGGDSALFKRNIFDLAKKEEIDARTKANFYKALDYLASVN